MRWHTEECWNQAFLDGEAGGMPQACTEGCELRWNGLMETLRFWLKVRPGMSRLEEGALVSAEEVVAILDIEDETQASAER